MQPCPSDAELLRHALTGGVSAPSSDPVTRHVAECARCRRDLAGVREAASGLREAEGSVPEVSSDCLDNDQIATLAEGLADGTVPASGLGHLAECGVCRERVTAVSRLLRHPEVAAEVGRVEAPSRSRRWFRVVGGLAGAAVLVMMVRSFGFRSQDSVKLREEPVTLISAPVPVQPAGIVARVDSLSWRTVPRATQYRITLFTQEGATVWDTGTRDTVVALPDRIHLAPGQVFYWKVEARTDWNRWTASDMIEIRIGDKQ